MSDAAAPVGYVNQGVPLRVVALMTQRGARALAVKKGSGITRPKDFEGRKVGIKTSAWTEYLVMLSRDLGYLRLDDATRLLVEVEAISKMLFALRTKVEQRARPLFPALPVNC